MHDILVCALSLGAGLAIAEYYRTRIDAIRKEQLDDMRGRRPVRREVWSEMEPAPRRSRDLISEEQYAEYRQTGRTRGKRVDGVDAK